MKISIKLVNIKLPILFDFDLKLLATFKNLRLCKELGLGPHWKSRQISLNKLSVFIKTKIAKIQLSKLK